MSHVLRSDAFARSAPFMTLKIEGVGPTEPEEEGRKNFVGVIQPLYLSVCPFISISTFRVDWSRKNCRHSEPTFD